MTAHVLVSEINKAPPTIDEGCKPFVIDGYPVNEGLYRFCNALRKTPAFRELKFGTRNMPLGYSAEQELWAYFPTQLYCLGAVRYADHNISDGSCVKYSYCVDSRVVENNKYRWGSKARYWALSTNLSRAVQNARKFFRPYSVVEIAGISCMNAASVMSSHSTQQNLQVTRALSDISKDIDEGTGRSKVFAELRHLLETGHKFTVDGVADLIQAAVDKAAVLKETSSHAYECTLLVANPVPRDGSPRTVRVVRGGPIHLDTNVRGKLQNMFCNEQHVAAHLKTVPIETLSEDILSRISMLAMVDDHEFVEGVGYKVNNDIMYLLH